MDDTLPAPGRDAHPVLGERYEILGLLGSGGMGNVYKARDLELDEVVALKVLRAEVVGAPGALDRFRREVKLARRITHPNVARMFDIGERGGTKILTMELIDGESLAAALARDGRIGVARIIELGTAVCGGLGAAHAAGVIHRDLKPDNVLIEKTGRVVLTDFGIATAAAAGDGSGTQSGFIGTPAYMAPEQVEGAQDLDARADLYALGAMLFELATGQVPWKAGSLIATAAARLLQPPPDPRAIRPEVPEPLAAVILRCMARRREDRPASADAVAAELAALAPGTPTPTPTPTPRPRSADAGKRIAVLPFRNAIGPDHDYLADGLTEELIDVLSMVEGLSVRSRGVVMRHRGSDRDPREVGRELDVQVVVDGTVRRADGTVRISARLISVADGVQLWARRFDRPDAELLGLSDDTARAIADALTVEIRSPARHREVAPEATELYLKARAAYHQFFTDMEGAHAQKLYEQALRLAPDNPRILAGYAAARSRVWGTMLENQETARLADRAVALAPDLAETHVARAAAYHQLDDEPEAMRSARRALQLAPGNAEAHDLIGRLLAETPRLAEARRHLRTALAIEPGIELPRATLIIVEGHLGDPEPTDRAIEAAAGGSRTIADIAIASRLVLWRRDRATAQRLLGTFPLTGNLLRMAHRFFTVIATGEQIAIPRPAALAPRVQTFLLQSDAEVAAAAGDRAGALDALERAVDAGFHDVTLMDRCPLFADLRDDPRFRAARAIVAARADEIVRAYDGR